MKKWGLGLVCLLSCSIGYAADIAGIWRSIDDKTGFSKGLVEIKKQPDGTYNGTIIKVIPRPNYIPKEFCQHCPAPYTNKPILGLMVITNLRQDSDNQNTYSRGKILDPLSGRIYSAKAKLNRDGHLLNMRGYVGVSVLGRSQTWIREE